jgi:hypothetical protein
MREWPEIELSVNENWDAEPVELMSHFSLSCKALDPAFILFLISSTQPVLQH